MQRQASIPVLITCIGQRLGRHHSSVYSVYLAEQLVFALKASNYSNLAKMM